MKKKILLVILVFLSTTVFSQENKNLKEKRITGIVSHDNIRLQNVNIIIKGANIGTSTNSKGHFSILAKTGQILTFSYLGLKTRNVLIKNNTERLNIKLESENSVLDEVNLKANNKDNNTSKILRLGKANINIRSTGFGIDYIDGKTLNSSTFDIALELQNKVPKVNIKRNRHGVGDHILYLKGVNAKGPAIWDVDGIVYKDTPSFINVSKIKHVAVIYPSLAKNIYGQDGSGGVIIISTQEDVKTPSYINKNYYKNDAIPYYSVKNTLPNYLKSLGKIFNEKEIYKEYKKLYYNSLDKNTFFTTVIPYFQKVNSNILLKTLTDFEDFSGSNIEGLKIIAYKYQELGEYEKALLVYKKIAKLKPNKAQSFRDLANNYLELKNYKSAWNIYKYYLIKGYIIENNHIGKIMNSEMIYTFLKREKDSTFKEILEINDPLKIIEGDIRLVFEWNNTDAEFIIELVSPKQQIIKFDNTLNNYDLITDQKKKGYNSKEFFIEKLEKENWLVNTTFIGNKLLKSSFLKLTTYYNWGRENQKAIVKVYELTNENVKKQLLKLNKSIITF